MTSPRPLSAFSAMLAKKAHPMIAFQASGFFTLLCAQVERHGTRTIIAQDGPCNRMLTVLKIKGHEIYMREYTHPAAADDKLLITEIELDIYLPSSSMLRSSVAAIRDPRPIWKDETEDNNRPVLISARFDEQTAPDVKSFEREIVRLSRRKRPLTPPSFR